MPQLPRFVMLPEDTPQEVMVYIKQLEWLADEAKQLISLIKSDDYSMNLSMIIHEQMDKIEKELNVTNYKP